MQGPVLSFRTFQGLIFSWKTIKTLCMCCRTPKDSAILLFFQSNYLNKDCFIYFFADVNIILIFRNINNIFFLLFFLFQIYLFLLHLLVFFSSDKISHPTFHIKISICILITWAKIFIEYAQNIDILIVLTHSWKCSVKLLKKLTIGAFKWLQVNQ
jgi:hypothetical protein